MCLKKVKLKTAPIDEVFVTEIKLDVIKLKRKLFTSQSVIVQDVITNEKSLKKGGRQKTNCDKRFHLNCCLRMSLSIHRKCSSSIMC